jgi:3-oxoadipate enol-lactonase
LERVTADDGVEVAARVEGPASGPVVLMLHSIGCDHTMWDAQAERLAGRYQVVRADLRGHGASDAPGGDYSLARLGRDAVNFLDGLGARTAVICGLSLGGLVAQEAALRAPERVAGLVLASTAPRIGTAEAWRQRADLVRAEGLEAIADLAMGRFFADAWRAAHPQVVARFRSRLLAMSAAGYAGCCAALRDADLSGEVGAIATPTLVIAGRRDVSTPPEVVRALAGDLEQSDYLELDAGHLSNVERPDEFTDALLQRLEAL